MAAPAPARVNFRAWSYPLGLMAACLLAGIQYAVQATAGRAVAWPVVVVYFLAGCLFWALAAELHVTIPSTAQVAIVDTLLSVVTALARREAPPTTAPATAPGAS